MNHKKNNKKTNDISFWKHLFFIISGRYFSFKNTIYFLIFNHWLMCLFIVAWLLWCRWESYVLTSSQTKELFLNFSFTFKKILISFIAFSFAIKLVCPAIIFGQKINITNKFKKYIWAELVLNPFCFVICLYKLITSPIYVWKRERPIFFNNCKNKLINKNKFPNKQTNNLLDIKNLCFVYHGDKGINKFTHYLMKIISPKFYKKHMCTENKTDEDINLRLKMDDFYVLKNVDLSFEKGKFITFFGANGSGKSTLIKIINNLIKEYEGDVFWMGKDAHNIAVKSFAQNVSYVSQQSLIYANITLYDFVLNGLFPKQKLFSKDKLKNIEMVKNTLIEFDLWKYKDYFLFNLSGGVKQKSIIARALIQNTKIIILDEPTTFLDINNQYLILNTIKKIQREKKITIFMILHNYDQAKKFSDEIVLLDKGMIYKSGKTEQIMTVENMKEIME